MKHIKSYPLFESHQQDDHEDVKGILKDWFDSYTDDIVEITTGRLWTTTEGECPSCKSTNSPVSLGYDYDSARVLYQCPDCDHVGSSEDFDSELELMMLPYSVWNKDVMNCITIRDLESGDFSLRFLTDKQIEHINSIIKPYGYTYFEWGISKRNFNSTITNFENIEKIKKKLDSEHTDTNIQIFHPKSESTLNESRLIMSHEMRQFIESHPGLWVSRKLMELQFDEEATDTINFFKPKGIDEVIFSKDNPDEGEDSFDWTGQSPKNAAKVGRMVRKLLSDNKHKVSDKDIEIFVNYWKSYFMNPEDVKVQIVQGEDIKKWYWKKYYHTLSANSPLGKSCMASKECQDFFDIYVKNPEVCQMIIMLDENEQLISRTLLWTDEEGQKIVDRIYYMNIHLEKLLIKWVRKNIPDAIIYGEDFYPGSPPKGIKIQLKEWKFKHYPYLDTFSTLNWKTGQLSADRWNTGWNDNKVPILTISTTDGGYRLTRSSAWCWSETMKDFLHKDLAYWDKEKRDYLPVKGIQKMGRMIKKWIDF